MIISETDIVKHISINELCMMLYERVMSEYDERFLLHCNYDGEKNIACEIVRAETYFKFTKALTKEIDTFGVALVHCHSYDVAYSGYPEFADCVYVVTDDCESE